MNVTLSLDEKLVEKCREIARRQGLSLNEMLRRYLHAVADTENSREAAPAALTRLWEESPGRSGGLKIRRDEAYDHLR
jgi:hypothetical protein